MQVQSNAFQPGDTIPARYTCDGVNISPELTFTNIPDDTESLALIVDDPDAPSGTFAHWIVYNLPGSTEGLPENIRPADSLPGDAKQGENDFGKPGYGGPCPPDGETHTYHFRLYALDEELDLPDGANRQQVVDRIEGHAIAEAELAGDFARS